MGACTQTLPAYPGELDLSSVRATLQAREIAPKKSLGQNFLVHPQVAEKIVLWADVPKDAPVLEIGPGLGAMTDILIQSHQVWAIEKDKKLYELLIEKYRDNAKISVIHHDALTLDYQEQFDQKKKYYLCSNLPYSISTPVIEKIIDNIDMFQQVTLLLQKELVDRMLGTPGTKNYGSLTVYVQTYFEASAGPVISANSFFPIPVVASKLIKLVPRKLSYMDDALKPLFSEFVKSMFQFRRKSIRKSLEHVLKRPASTFEKDLPVTTLADRVENLSTQELYELFKAVRS